MTMKAILRVKCKNCGNWTKIEAEKIFISNDISEAKVKIFLPAFRPMKTEKCSECNHVIAKGNGVIKTRKYKQ